MNISNKYVSKFFLQKSIIERKKKKKKKKLFVFYTKKQNEITINSNNVLSFRCLFTEINKRMYIQHA